MEIQSDVHFLPCDIDKDGSTNIKAYFKVVKTADGKLRSQLRGHELQGDILSLSKEGLPVQGVVATKGQLTGEGTKLEITGRFDSITVWQHDLKPDLSQIQEYIDWFEVSNAVHG